MAVSTTPQVGLISFTSISALIRRFASARLRFAASRMYYETKPATQRRPKTASDVVSLLVL